MNLKTYKKLHPIKLTAKQQKEIHHDPTYYFMDEILNIVITIGDLVDWKKKKINGPKLEDSINTLIIKVHKRAQKLANEK